MKKVQNMDPFRSKFIKRRMINHLPGFKFIAILILINSCIVQFIPDTEEEKELLVVEGLITDQPGPYIVELSKSLPFGKKSEALPLGGSIVNITDDLGNTFYLTEREAGKYFTDSTNFKGQIGRIYTLRITASIETKILNYESLPMEMKSVPPIDSIYYEKTVIKESIENFFGINGCMIYLDTNDPENNCRYYRWDFTETWVLRLLFPVENIKCWISDNSKEINFKSTAAFDEARIIRHPITYISNITDRLKTKYSISVNQYSLNEDEYLYWEKLQHLNDQVGGLYDIIPSSIPSNILCIENPGEKVLGYFSVSAKSSKRIFIKDIFSGIIDRYSDCITDTVYGDFEIPGINSDVWVLSDNPPSFPSPRTRILTDKRGCADCTVRGTIKRPDFWIGE